MFRPITKGSENARSLGYFIPSKVSSLDRSSILNKSNKKKQVTFRDISNSISVQPENKVVKKSSLAGQTKSQSQKYIRKYNDSNRN